MGTLYISKGFKDLNITLKNGCTNIINNLKEMSVNMNNACIVCDSLDEMINFFLGFNEFHYIFESGFYAVLDVAYTEDCRIKQLEILLYISNDIDNLCDRYSYSESSDEIKLLMDLLYFFARISLTTRKNEFEWLNIIDKQYIS
ncbi:hypothetical protein [Clostridium neonatale]|uniref:Uncharacterized protein n=1 Tax=Clostridium neonatale TaxID=137838 RepID=A0AAD1YFN2_9CLOT|nr:hypothetical protein [Clostridium neonatale]CAI3204378.1 hypothetical protein CNEO2_250061 [Clostridium neonatale]CAI3204859.1 hypothetical protein CNEO2_390002 [Clostridium neonatale]CAI3208909.1 hypothetical protein CNEO2_440062 [Clostridium neonatale]CAI3239890.1 hypothetical protein CNEO2_330062 [Clostridium neonatale]CAI3240367.1 hypothetical protein CNEO2_350061 [Clostridium neonatale]